MKVILPILPKLVANLPWQRPVTNWKNRGPDRLYPRKYLSLMKKIVKIDLVDPEIIGLPLKKGKKATEGKICSLVGKFAERAKNFCMPDCW